ncbi:MAG TPA: glutathione S-transferase [Deltaproteobacteria bacterium]|nr:glutathione S-transferase [Deltaproteobacteria bacterium]
MAHVTALYAGLLGLLAIALALAVGRLRNSEQVSIGDGGNLELIAAMRRHANFVEFVPLTLILIGLLETNGVSAGAIHGLGASLLLARVCHAVGYGTNESLMTFRIIGAAGSTLVLAVASIWSVAVFF